MEILFYNEKKEFRADCHVKSALGSSQKYFVIKIASGFYENIKIGKDVNNGMLIVICSKTGEFIALLEDKGYLTSHRTAAAGALAASLKEVSTKDILGIIGTGNQAKLQAIYITKYLGLSKVLIYGRNKEKALTLCEELKEFNVKANFINTTKELCHKSSIVITTTPSITPILKYEDLPKNLHIVALGADSSGKIELEPKIIKKSKIVITDDHKQCLEYGEYGSFVKEYNIKEHNDYSLGKLLNKNFKIREEGISVVDLTGLGTQDLAIASCIMKKF
jgi:ornithine cyclodeaminase